MLSLAVYFDITDYFKGKLDKYYPTRLIITLQQLMRIIFQRNYIMWKSYAQINTYNEYIYRVVET